MNPSYIIINRMRRTLVEYFDDYYESYNAAEKEAIKEAFKNELWGCVPYTKQLRYAEFTFNIYENAVRDKELIPVFQEFKQKALPYTIKTQYYIWSSDLHISWIDTVKIHINNQFARAIDPDVFISEPKYYSHLAHIKNIYFGYLDGKYNAEEVVKVLNDNYNEALKYKQLSDEKKYKMTWEEYQEFINRCFDRIFENYVSWDDKVLFNEEIEWKHYTRHDDWDKDAAWVIGYINKSLEGYFKSLLGRNIDFKDKICEVCGTTYSSSRKSKKCISCAAEHRKSYLKNYNYNDKEKVCSCTRCGIDINYTKRKIKYCDSCKKKIKQESNKKHYIKRKN